MFHLLLFLCAVSARYIPVYVILPLDVITDSRTVNNPSTLLSQLQTLKSVGVDGVVTDVWWGYVERDGPKSYYWDPYVQLINITRQAGLKFQAIMSFHQCGGNTGDSCNIPLPPWVTSVGNSNPDIFYRDREGGVDKEYLSCGIDDQQLFSGRSPVQMYADFMTSFRDYVLKQNTDIITQVAVSLGPAGELRYPAYQLSKWTFCGVGEFQCYDKYLLAQLSAAAASVGHPEWGNGGPSNAGTYNSNPLQTPFYQDGTNDNYASDYGRFFLKWYSDTLVTHGDKILAQASAVFKGYTVKLAAKVAGIHWWYKSNSHGAELTSGYYNTNGNNGYATIANMFKKYNTSFDFTCMEMKDSEQPASCDCGPQELVAQVISETASIGLAMDGENALNRYDSTAYNQIESEVRTSSTFGVFDYLRLDSTLLQSGNLATFQQFVSTMHNL